MPTSVKTENTILNERGESVTVRAEIADKLCKVQMQLGWRSSGEVRLELTIDEAWALYDVLNDVLGVR